MEEILKRFWAKVHKIEGGCWEWKAGRNRDGYGTFNVEGKTLKAHRVSWMIHNGWMPERNVCHHCDNPGCVNPAHLFLGTQAENIADRHSKGRTATGRKARGPERKNFPLTYSDIDAIKDAYLRGATARRLSLDYGTTERTILKAAQGFYDKPLSRQ